MVGLTQGILPRFAKRHANVGELIEKSVATYCEETTKGIYPDESHCYTIDAEVSDAIRKALESRSI